MEKNFTLKWLLLAFALSTVLAGCNKDLENDVNDLKDRVTTLEDSVKGLQEAIAEGRLITDVKPINGEPGGWEIFFAKKPSIKIYNGAKGDTGDKGDKVDTPYIWVNSNGYWASNLGAKPVDSDNAKYELKVGGNSLKANGVSVRVINKDGYVAFEEYDAVTNEIKNTVTTNFPFYGSKIITAVFETDESVTFTIDGVSYCLAKAAIYPTSITVIRDKDYVIKGGTVEFNIAVNPATSKIYTKENFELDFEKDYTRAYGVTPDFITIKSVVPDEKIKGQYTMALEWKQSASGFIKDAAIFVVLNYTDVEGKNTQVISATPVIMNEKYVRITDDNVALKVDNIVMFTDETFTDSVRLINYHEGYVDMVNYTYIGSPTQDPVAINPLTRDLNLDDKYKFTVVPISADDATVWPDGVFSRHTDVTVAVNGAPEGAKFTGFSNRIPPISLLEA